MCGEHFVSAADEFNSAGSFDPVFSGLEIPFPGNGNRGWQRAVRLSGFRGSEAEHLVLA
jgi:hypothetical protein